MRPRDASVLFILDVFSIRLFRNRKKKNKTVLNVNPKITVRDPARAETPIIMKKAMAFLFESLIFMLPRSCADRTKPKQIKR